MRVTIETNLRETFVSEALAILGANGVLTAPSDMEGYCIDWRRRYEREALLVALPSTVEQVSQLVKLSGSLGVAVVPQSGNTGMTGGAVAPEDRPSVILNLSRLNRVRAVDAANNSVTAEAGCILASLRETVAQSDRLFPMLLGSVGSCQVGGLVSTNAGGTNVLRYGNMRDLILGLEVVLADGQIWNGLRELRKDNSGYDLKQMFIGAEGTLGVVTAATLKLFPATKSSGTAMVAVPDVQSALDLLQMFTERTGGRVDAFELISQGQVETVIAFSDRSAPMPLTSPWFVLIEIADSNAEWDATRQLEDILADAVEAGLVNDAIIAADLAKAERLWEIRHCISEVNRKKGFSIANDTSVPVACLPRFLDGVTQRLTREIAHADVYHAGHLGDGNIHVIIVLDTSFYQTVDERERAAAKANFIVHEESVELGGSISAEHGIGLMHVDELAHFKNPLDLQMMATLKRAFDPRNLMNPGKILKA